MDGTDADDVWDVLTYDIEVSVTVSGGAITAVDLTDDVWDVLGDDENADYLEKAAYGNKRVTGMFDLITANGSVDGVDTVSSATISSNAIIEAVNSALQVAYDEQNPSTDDGDDNQGTTDPVEDEYTYGYAGLTWSEYWAAENVYAAGDTTSSDELDEHKETDKGAFDVVSRATTNHGLHRGSFQCMATIYGESGTAYELASWASDGSAFYTTDGQEIGYSKGALTLPDGSTDQLSYYEVSGIKYVPVAVKTSDLEAFEAKYDFVANGEELAGGYSEQQLSAYTATADVDADTNGLKTATLDGDSFTFSAAQTGTTSGIEGQDLKTADLSSMGPKLDTVDGTLGTYGEFIRLDFKTDYGDLGANMQSVTWTYYGDDSTYTDVKATFGTKFAADNWMHKSNGIQLGLTDSLRCQLPEGTDGTGYWKVTIHALGYADASYTFEATEDNILEDATPVTDETKAELEALVDKAKALTQSSYSEESWKASSIETELAEAEELLAKDDLSEAAASEQIEHLQAALEALVKIAPEAGDYILMNIPYDEFYAMETDNNDVAVDVFSSATKNKVRTGSLAGGSYHVDDSGDAINGITYPVLVTEEAAKNIDWSKYTQITDDSSVDITVTNRGQTSTTTYTGSDALFEAADYAYYICDGEQTNYKELTADESGTLSFSKVKGAEAKSITGSATLTTDTTYGDYELDFTDQLVEDLKDEEGNEATVYAVVVNTTDGTGYGMRHLENIWRTTELAWCTGFTSAVHNCPTSSEHYKSMMGKTISSVTYYTSNGVYEVAIDETYVPIKAESSLEATADADADAATIIADLPFTNVKYTLDGEEVTVENGALDISSLKPGTHTLVAKDAEDKYADVSATFTVSTNATVVDFDGTSLVAAEGATADDLTNYVSNISSVSVNGTAYAASGRGAVTIINSDGSLNLEAASNGAAIFNGYGDYEIVVTSAGYPELSTTVSIEADKTSLDDAIAKAEAVTDEDSYTKASWTAFQKALTAAQEVAGNSAATDEEVSEAATALTNAQSALALKATDDEKTALQEAIDKTTNQTSGLNESDYTAESWKALQDALKVAQALIDDEDASAADVAAAQADLESAYNGLTKAEDDGSSEQGTNPTPANPADEGDDTGDGSDAGDDATPKTGDPVGIIAGAFAAIAAAAAGAAAFARRKFMGK